MTYPDLAIAGSYDYRLVGLSVLIAMLASYVALDLAGRITSAHGRARVFWLNGGAVAMGIGIWSMHYIGMLAFRLPIPVRYDWHTVLLSLLAAIFASAVALFVVSRREMGIFRALVGSVCMGGGIAAMHYTGMAAMRLPAMCRYSPALVMLSVVLAIVISLVALWLTFHLRRETKEIGWRKIVSAIVMGAAIPVMHYTGMAAASFTPSSMANEDLSHAVSISSLGIAGITTVTLMVLGLALLTSSLGRRFSAQALQLELTEGRYRQLVESAEVILWRRNVGTSQFTFVSKEAEVLLGYPAEQWVNTTTFWADHVHSEDRARIEECFAKTTEENESQSIEHRMIASGGRVVWLRTSVRAAMMGDGEKELVGVMLDITERKRVEEALGKAKEELEVHVEQRTAELYQANTKLNSVLDAATLVSVIATDPHGLITLFNSGAERLLHYTADEMVGKQTLAIILLASEMEARGRRLSAEFGRAVGGFEVFVEYAPQGKYEEREWTYVRKDGEHLVVSVVVTAVKNRAGEITGYLGMAMDVTGRKRTEQALEHSRQEQMRLKDEFLSHVSHELRSPLAAIYQFVTILADGIAGETNPEQGEYLQIILRNVRQLQSMIDDLLEVTRVQAGKLVVQLQCVSVSEAIVYALETLKRAALAKGIALRFNLPARLPLVYADPIRVRQILIILLDNAIKFTPANGGISIRGCVAEEDPGFLLVEVSDTGCGISPNMAGRIFERLHQVAGPIEAGRQGLGLGLYICKELVTRQGGQIRLSSQRQQGSTFSFTLPLVSIASLISPLLKDETWPADSVALVMVEICTDEISFPKEKREECSREAHNVLERCLLPDLDVLLPKAELGEARELFFVVSFADETGATILTRRIRDQFANLKQCKLAGLMLSVSYTMVEPISTEPNTPFENIVGNMVTKIEDLIESKTKARVVHHE